MVETSIILIFRSWAWKMRRLIGVKKLFNYWIIKLKGEEDDCFTKAFSEAKPRFLFWCFHKQVQNMLLETKEKRRSRTLLKFGLSSESIQVQEQMQFR
jgi:hypothetical protein